MHPLAKTSEAYGAERRAFLRAAAAGAGALALAGRGATGAAEPRADAAASRGLPPGWRALRKFDAHHHVFGPFAPRPNSDWAEVERLVLAAEWLGIEKVCCSRPVTGGLMADIELVRESNNAVLAAMKRHPRLFAGYCFVQPGNGAAALDEIDRCLDAGMIGVKLYNQFKFSDPAVFPIAEKCIARRALFLGHSGYLTDPRALARQPRISHALDFGALSRRYPELMLILGHINGGGDWEWTIRALRDSPNVVLDTSGSGMDDDTIGRCVRELGHRRVLFATDGAMEGGVGKILSAQLTAEQREDIFWRNLQRLIDRRTA